LSTDLKNNRKRLEIRLQLLDFDGCTTDDIIIELTSLKSYYCEYDTLIVKEQYPLYEQDKEIVLYGCRLENDREYDKRIKQEKFEELRRERNKKKDDEYQYKQYLKLKKKFEKYESSNN
jgi:hypothetical protein